MKAKTKYFGMLVLIFLITISCAPAFAETGLDNLLQATAEIADSVLFNEVIFILSCLFFLFVLIGRETGFLKSHEWEIVLCLFYLMVSLRFVRFAPYFIQEFPYLIGM